jgi:hypothetical protein
MAGAYANDYVWCDWNSAYSTCNSSCVTSSSTSIVWTIWNTAYDATATGSVTCTDTVWTYWNEGYPARAVDPVALEAARLEQERALAQEIARRQAAVFLRDEADKRAEALLAAHLTPRQREQYREHRYFEVITRTGRYRLAHGWAGNVHRVDDQDRLVERFCIHPARVVPYADNLLAQKLMLETDEERFLRVANKTRLAA